MSNFDINWVHQFITKKDNLIVFDIGAHNFSDSINFKRALPSAKVYAFEADKINVEKLENLIHVDAETDSFENAHIEIGVATRFSVEGKKLKED